MCRKPMKVETMELDLADHVYAATEHLPQRERFALGREMRRSAVSVGSNLAEGRGRRSGTEFARFVDIAVGSARELQFQADLARRQDLVSDETHGELSRQIDALIGACIVLARRLRRN